MLNNIILRFQSQKSNFQISMSFYSNFGFLPPTTETGEVWKTTNDIPPQWDAQTLQVRNMGPPTQPNDATTKSYVDTNSVRGILTTNGDLVVFSDNSGDPKPIRLQVGLDDQVIVADSSLDEGLKYTNDLIGLNDIVMVGELMVDSIVKNASSFLTLEDTVLINNTGTTTVLQIGVVTAPQNTNDVELNLIAKRDCSIFIKADEDNSGAMDSAFLSCTIKANTIFAGISLNKPSNQMEFQVASTEIEPTPNIVFLVNGSYEPTNSRPNPSSFIIAMIISGDNGNVTIPTQILTDKLITTNMVSTFNLRAQRQFVTNTTTLTTDQIFGGFLQCSPISDVVYTLPTSFSIINAVKSPIVGQFFKVIIFNNSAEFQINLNRNNDRFMAQNVLTNVDIGGKFGSILPFKSFIFIIVFVNIITNFEVIEIIEVDI